ncbi:MAG: pyridoxamine 5'-phosphate oxidase family protein [Eudoraea sp.]|uniref:pyridoxamine 5'-phosphate oxidase family protein n=1 Tax=Eudoraea sp. TaxID=1979955 RepID=UPI0032647E7C
MIENLETRECTELLNNNYIGHLAFISHKEPFVMPITYYYDQVTNTIIAYSAEGHKIDAMRQNDAVSLEVEEIKSVNKWRSVHVHGTFEELQGIDAKYLLHKFTQNVKKIITRKEGAHPKFISEFSSKLSEQGIPIVYRININEITGKYRNH